MAAADRPEVLRNDILVHRRLAVPTRSAPTTRSPARLRRDKLSSKILEHRPRLCHCFRLSLQLQREGVMEINWYAPPAVRFDSNSLDPLATHGIPLPTYGNYGGPN